MTNVLNNVAAKLGVAFVAAAMLFTYAAPVKAQTAAELQQMINDLLAQVASLQAQLGGGGTTGGGAGSSGVCPYTWTRSLTVGDTGNDVLLLQQFLNADPDTRVAATGVGSAGQETQYYGSLTGAAVAKFQAKYRSDILSPLGLVNPTTYFGPSTMAKANMLCTSAPVMDDDANDDANDDMDDDANDDANDDDDDNGALSGGEASLESFEGSDGDDTDLEEGQNDAPVAEFEFDVEDGDIKISRIDVAFKGTGDETDPWDTFEEVSIWVDGDKIAEMNADDEDDWQDDDPVTGTHRLRFTGLDWVEREGDTAMFVVGVSVQSNVDIGTDSDAWEVFIPVDGIRGRDGAGIDQYTGDTNNTSPTESVDFDIDEEGGEDELKIQTSTDDPDATTLPVEETTNSDWFTVFAFDLDTDDSVNDIEVETAVIKVVTPGDIYNDVVNDAQLVIGSQTFDDFTVTGGTTATATLTFDIDKELVIDAGDEVTAEFQLEFKKLTGNYSEGQSVYATTTASLGWDAEGADDLSVEPPSSDQLTGSAIGETHTLRTQGVILDFDSESFSKDINSDTTEADDEGIFTLKFEVEAFEQDVYVPKTAGRGATATTSGVSFLMESGGTTVTTGTTTASLTSTADTDGTRFRVSEGETETFTLKVTFDPATSNFYALQLNGFNFNDSNAAPDTTQLALPEEDFETDEYDI